MPHQCTTCGHVFPDGSKEMLSGCPDCGGNAFQFHPEGADIPDEPPDADPPDPEEEPGGTVGRAASTVRNLVSSEEGPPDSGDTAATPPEDAADPRPDAPWPDDGPDDSTDDGDIIVAEETDPGSEDAAQASARTDFATSDELSGQAGDAPDPSPAPDTPDEAVAPDEAIAPDETAAPPEFGDVEGPVEATESGDGGVSAAAPDVEEGRVVSEPAEDQPGLAELREQLNDQFESIKIVEPGQYELNLMELYDREEYIIALQENGRYVIQVPENWLGDEPGED